MQQPASHRRLALLAALVVAWALAVPAASQEFPTLVVDPGAAVVGETVTAEGTTFDPDTPVDLRFGDGGPLVAEAVSVGGDGSFTTSFSVPDLPALVGTDGYRVTALQDGEPITDDVLRILPTLSVTPTSVPGGARVTVRGSGWDRTRTLTLELPDGTPAATIPADGSAWVADSPSRFRTTLTVPDIPAGDVLVTAHQFDRRLLERTRLTIEADLAVAPPVGLVGDRPRATGRGFDPSCPVEVVFDGPFGGSVVATVPAGREGTGFSRRFMVPPRSPGPHRIVATQEPGGSGCSIRAGATFTVAAVAIALDPASGPVETEVTVRGGGFGPLTPVNRNPVSLDVDGTPVGTVPPDEIDADGTFTTTITIPDHAGGPAPVNACQRCGTRTEALATAPFTVEPSLELDPPLGAPGFVTVATGRGFPDGEDVVVEWDPGVGSAGAVPDADGRFRVPLLVLPRSEPGPRTARGVIPGDDVLPEPEAPFLVVPGTVQPGDFRIRR